VADEAGECPDAGGHGVLRPRQLSHCLPTVVPKLSEVWLPEIPIGMRLHSDRCTSVESTYCTYIVHILYCLLYMYCKCTVQFMYLVPVMRRPLLSLTLTIRRGLCAVCRAPQVLTRHPPQSARRSSHSSATGYALRQQILKHLSCAGFAEHLRLPWDIHTLCWQVRAQQRHTAGVLVRLTKYISSMVPPLRSLPSLVPLRAQIGSVIQNHEIASLVPSLLLGALRPQQEHPPLPRSPAPGTVTCVTIPHLPSFLTPLTVLK